MSAESPLRDGDGPGFKLIETLRWEPENGFLRLERHLQRLADSAAELGFACTADMALEALHGAVRAKDKDTPQRLRLLAAQDGTMEATAQPFQPLPAGSVWTLQVAATRLSSANMLLRHKTTRRDIYDEARAEYPAAKADEVLLANEQDEICEGTITSLFADFGDGYLVTPPLGCGLLAGVLRAELIEQGRAVEGVIPLASLGAADAFFVGNSLRGLIPARLSA